MLWLLPLDALCLISEFLVPSDFLSFFLSKKYPKEVALIRKKRLNIDFYNATGYGMMTRDFTWPMNKKHQVKTINNLRPMPELLQPTVFFVHYSIANLMTNFNAEISQDDMKRIAIEAGCSKDIIIAFLGNEWICWTPGDDQMKLSLTIAEILLKGKKE